MNASQSVSTKLRPCLAAPAELVAQPRAQLDLGWLWSARSPRCCPYAVDYRDLVEEVRWKSRGETNLLIMKTAPIMGG